jgi:hypothetical protein
MGRTKCYGSDRESMIFEVWIRVHESDWRPLLGEAGYDGFDSVVEVKRQLIHSLALSLYERQYAVGKTSKSEADCVTVVSLLVPDPWIASGK